LEATGKPADRVQALILKRQAFDELLAGAMRN
jgi:hypothetical protein